MFEWYRNSAICYAHLVDVGDVCEDFDVQFTGSRRFTRGWTLQELLAPDQIIFFNKHWRECGDKKQLWSLISSATGIDNDILKYRSSFAERSVARRMSWASRRMTTRKEDMAYSLLGIFGVNMAILYGEGDRAFIRLQEEITRISNDHSIFAWGFDHKERDNLCPVAKAKFQETDLFLASTAR
jgi:hypothetical protein